MPPTPTLTHNSALSSPISGSSPVEINKIDPRDGQQNGKEKEDCGESNERNWAIKKLNQKLLPNSCGRVERQYPVAIDSGSVGYAKWAIRSRSESLLSKFAKLLCWLVKYPVNSNWYSADHFILVFFYFQNRYPLTRIVIFVMESKAKFCIRPGNQCQYL